MEVGVGVGVSNVSNLSADELEGADVEDFLDVVGTDLMATIPAMLENFSLRCRLYRQGHCWISR
jgi:hypothetical protein